MRHRVYRANRPSLRSVVPSDVWTDGERALHMVTFTMANGPGPEAQLAFAVDSNMMEVASTGILVLEASKAGWKIQTLPASA